MKMRAHIISTVHGRLLFESCKVKEALTGARRHKGSYWIDIDADEEDAEELQDWLNEQLKLSPFLMARLAVPAADWASQVLAFDEIVLSVVRILPSFLHGSNSRRSHPTTTSSEHHLSHMAALSMKHLLLTFTSCPRSDTAGLYASALAYLQARLPEASSSGALCAWLLYHVERTSRAVRELRADTLRMDQAMDANIKAVSLDEVVQAKDSLLQLLSVAEEQMECLEALAGAASGGTQALELTSLRGTLGVLRATAAATERMALRLEKHLADLRQRHESHQQERLNRRLAVLTVLSAVFLPLTLVTGIWGKTQFEHYWIGNEASKRSLDVPYDQSRHGSLLTLLLLVLLCAAAKFLELAGMNFE
jgi:Mg2+ and Co2+ transporter CorA